MDSSAEPPPAAGGSSGAPTGASEDGTHDWTHKLAQTDHVRFFRETDWNRNGLGPPKDWDPTLQLFANFVHADSRAACLWWGPDAVAIYNEAFAPMCHGVHPALMGSTYARGFPELWPYIRLMFEESARTGIGQNVNSDTPLLVERNGWREEAFFSGSFIPIGPPHHPLGFYNSVFEVTDHKLADRRTSMLNKLAAVPDQKTNVVMTHVLTTLATNPHDVPLAVMYKFDFDDTLGERTTLRLQGQIGLPEGHKLLVDVADITSDEGLVPELRRAGSEAIFIDCDQRFDNASWRGWEAPSKKIAVLPISSSTRLFGYLVVGLNPYRPFDDSCRQFVYDLNRMVSSIVSAAINFELAETRRDQLECDLAVSNLKLRHLVEHASVGMCHVAIDGEMLWANDQYFRLAGRSAEQHLANYSFYDAYLEEDLPQVREVWQELLAGVEHIHAEFRMKRTYTSPTGEEIPASIQVLAFPYRDPDSGHVRSVMACTTDISRLKWAQAFHARSAAEAREAKRQQEAFIDVVSHEMRNPLGAIVHCADAIIAMAEESKCAGVTVPGDGALAEIVQHAKIVLQCATHQRRILDDVLTLSKLKSMLLSIKPVAVEPSSLIRSIMNMFDAELDSSSIRCTVNVDSSLSDLAIDQVYLDSSRVTQILINLVTNAIKFLKLANEPSVLITLGACASHPRGFFPDKMFWADGEPSSDVTNTPEWGTGEQLYLTMIVEDSGIGMTDDDIARLFKRFSQANIKTHVTYGGSGLGLYISKELAEKQGGEIGVTSVSGKGSKFGFYVKCRRREEEAPDTTKPINGTEHPTTVPQQLHILLVEDNLINQKVLSMQLRRGGCIVEVANHGIEALEYLEKSTFDAVLMDSEMPILDGLAATRMIRQRELEGKGLLNSAMARGPRAGTRLPVIAVTANVREEQIQAAMDAGSDDVVQKPFKVQELLDRIYALIHETSREALVNHLTSATSTITLNEAASEDQ
ncbi:hypothetical protein DPSP01_004149 [Paraphaeosphaeria sporulosa]|uniref:Putative histidine kinase-like protein M3YPp n=1 Tax=Paraphaeosphaeria sporulosa TaxID=1460663 RepID=A0A177CBD7_9PLEO|nr:putative histidine kinase-like protein M3YPp [Paraphaeosphaeria sporulosa]OAG04646.1 putative histidine kinase-like protein M3YPp [Paraphaeosphaeria sporulosa]